MPDYSHMDALQFRLSYERSRLSVAKSQKEKALRTVWIAQVKRKSRKSEDFSACRTISISTYRT